MSSTRGTSEGSGGTSSSLSYDDCFDLLSNHRRRYALQYLKENGETATLGELSDQIAAWENEVDVEEISYDERKRVYTSLQQVHLPRMDDMDVVEFDDREGVVEVGPGAEELATYLGVAQRRDIPWSGFYLGLVGVNTVVLAAAALGVSPVASVEALGLAVLVVTTFLVLSVTHAYVTRRKTRPDQHVRPPGRKR